jgi:hypothetical protein
VAVDAKSSRKALGHRVGQFIDGLLGVAGSTEGVIQPLLEMGRLARGKQQTTGFLACLRTSFFSRSLTAPQAIKCHCFAINITLRYG